MRVGGHDHSLARRCDAGPYCVTPLRVPSSHLTRFTPPSCRPGDAISPGSCRTRHTHGIRITTFFSKNAAHHGYTLNATPHAVGSEVVHRKPRSGGSRCLFVPRVTDSTQWTQGGRRSLFFPPTTSPFPVDQLSLGLRCRYAVLSTSTLRCSMLHTMAPRCHTPLQPLASLSKRRADRSEGSEKRKRGGKKKKKKGRHKITRTRQILVQHPT